MSTDLKHRILGTAGHIDHGKSTLIHALTGIDPDRLPEEKQRGITIELGFAHLELDNGFLLGIVDVPGHEKFVHHMVAGTGGIDMVLLVIAADEGVMPQTREHLDICNLLGVQHGLVVITKKDLVEPDWLDLVIDDVRSFIQGSFLDSQPVIPVSSVSKEGLNDLKKALCELAERTTPKNPDSLFRLPIDRVFSIKGFGTVVTGTILSGRVQTGETIELVPGNIPVKIRGIQVHNVKTDAASAGHRTAINLQNIEKSEIERGMVLTAAGSFRASSFIDVECRFLPFLPHAIKNRSSIRFHSGTSEAIGQIIFLDRESVKGKETCFAQIRLENNTAVLPGDRFLLRSYSPVHTIGGGRVVDTEVNKHRRFDAGILSMLRQFIDPELKNRLMARLSFSRGISLKELQMKFPDESGQVSSLLESLCESKQVLKISAAGTIYMTHEIWNQFQGSIVETVSSFHKKNPLRLGIGKEELRSTLDPKPDLVMLSTALDRLISDQRIGEIKGRYHLVTFGVHLNPEQQKLKTRLLDIFRKAGSAGLDEQEIRDQLQMEGSSTQPLMTYLVENNMIIRLPGGLMFLSEIISEFQEGIRTLIRTEGNLTVGRFRDHFGISRKQAVPLLEYFDVQGLTRRVQDHRVLR